MGSILEHETRAVASFERPAVGYAPLIAAAIAAIGILVVHGETALSMVLLWSRSDTFAHGYVVVPIALWLAWRQRRQLLATPMRPAPAALLVVAGMGALWLVASVAEVNAPRQFALVLMTQAAIVAVLGMAIARAAALPLLFLLFAVPAGEFLLPTLIDWTADFTVSALRLSGVPVYRHANQFVIPSGSWSVVEACSGLRYLVASLMIGVVYAAISYRTTWRRVAFITASIIVPIIANWLRAYMIVMLGHLSDNRLAVGVDHLIYGWLFFGIVMALLFWVGSLWSEPDAEHPVAPRSETIVGPRVEAQPIHFYATAIAAIVLAALWRPVFALVDDTKPTARPALSAVGANGGFTPADASLPQWTPSYDGHAATLRQTFVNNGAEVALYVAFYRNQQKKQELVTTANQLVRPRDATWKELERDDAVVLIEGRPTEAVRSVLSDMATRLVVYRLYWVDGVFTTSDYIAKARIAWSKLRGRGDDAALVVFYASEHDGRDVARAGLEALLPQVSRMLAATRAQE